MVCFKAHSLGESSCTTTELAFEGMNLRENVRMRKNGSAGLPDSAVATCCREEVVVSVEADRERLAKRGSLRWVL